jgi:hypothetical protein
VIYIEFILFLQTNSVFININKMRLTLSPSTVTEIDEGVGKLSLTTTRILVFSLLLRV